MREEALIAQACVLRDKHEALAAASGERLNLFAILGRETDEVHTHTGILSELLNPKGTHGQGAVFLRLFAEQHLNIEDLKLDDSSVRREVAISEESRADILMEVGDTGIVIENKIHAGDQTKQLERYHAYVADRYSRFKVFYLTLHGNDPSDGSLGNLSRDAVACVSYESDVLAWLDDCIKEVVRVPQIREILAHYQALLRKLTGKATGELTMDLKKLLGQKSVQDGRYNFEVAPAIAEAMTAFSIETEWEFWKALKKQLLKAGDDGPWKLTLAEDIKDASNGPKEVSREVVSHAHDLGRKNRWRYGCTLRINSDDEPTRYQNGDIEALLRVECDNYGWVFYGLVAVSQTGNGKRQLGRSDDTGGLFNELTQRMQELEKGWRTDKDSWLVWAWPTNMVDLRKTMWLAPDVIRRMIDNLAGAVEPLNRDIQHTIDLIEGSKRSSE